MENIPVELPFLSNLGLMLTFKCTTACPHCVVEASPRRKEEMRLDQAIDWISQARNYGDSQIVGLALTGGEPFCIMDKLIEVAEFGCQQGFLISVVTNAFWAATEEAAISVLSRLPTIQMVSMSTDIYHQKTIPFENIKNAIRACRKLGCVYNIAVCTDYEDNPQYQKIIEGLKALGEGDRIRPAITYPVGRAQNLASHFNYSTSPEPPVSACTMASSPIVFPDGKMLACIGPLVALPPTHPMYLGNLQQESLAEILKRAEINPILHIIRVWGPYKLVSMLRENGFGELLPKEYLSSCICDVCYKLMSNEKILAALNAMLRERKMQEYVAYARIYYLNETIMAQFLQLDDESKKTMQQSQMASAVMDRHGI
jgi:MoaA/NifB/PqqE/SkfB family radical SAM enzyme